MDAVLLQTKHLNNRQILLPESKYANRYYEYLPGVLPMISEETEQLLVADEEGAYFHKDINHYRQILRKAIEDEHFRIADIRRQYKEERKRRLGHLD